MISDELNQARSNYCEYCYKIEKYYSCISYLKNDKSKIECMEELYRYVKEIALKLCESDKNFDKNYFAISSLLLKCERLLPNKYIIDVKPNYNSNDNVWVPGGKPQDILNFITNCARNFVCSKVHYQENQTLESINMVGQCLPVSNFIENLCNELNIKCRKIGLFPGFTTTPILCNGLKQHYAVIIEIDKKEYLVDCTYAQFFGLNRCILERLGVPKLSGCLAGIFMMMNESRIKVAEKILRDGWIKLEGNVLKDYLDGFAISYRNGLYYEKTGDFSYETRYSVDDYKNFLNGCDSQLNHEPRKFLDSQKIPLQDYSLIFKR